MVIAKAQEETTKSHEGLQKTVSEV